MNPIANLPATQNLNRPQQSQGYNRQYFGGDEVDQFELSQEAEEAAAEEQNKKKIWAYAAGIGAAIVAGAAVLLGLRATGHATWAKLGNNENSLTGLTKLSKTQGDTVKKGATLAEGAMKGTLSGGSWNGISTSITGSASQYNNIIFIGKKENFDALKEKITDSAIVNKLKHIACETWASLQKDENFTDNIGQEKVAFIVDTDLRNADGGSVYEKIKEFWDKGDSASGDAKAEEKKEEETTTETDGGTGSVKDTTQDEAAKVKAKKKEDMKAIDEAINNKQAQVLNNELVKEDGENITFTIAENQTKKYTMKATSYAPNETDKADLPAGSKKIVWNSDHMYYIENKDGTISVKELTEPAKPKVETPKVETPKVEIPKVETPKVESPKVEIPKVETPAVTPAPANGNQADGQKTVTPEAGTPTPAVTPDVTPAVNTVGGQKPPTASGAAPTGGKPADKPAANEIPPTPNTVNPNATASSNTTATGTTVGGQQNTGGTQEGEKQKLKEILQGSVEPPKLTEFPKSVQKILDDSQTPGVAAGKETKVDDSTATGTTVGVQQNTNDKPVDSSNANENAADSNPPIATGAATGAPADGQPAATGNTGVQQNTNDKPADKPAEQNPPTNPVENTVGGQQNTDDKPVEPKVDEVNNNINPKK